jgi:DNA-binding response OmpR family regulator
MNRILLVDDDQEVRAVLGLVLRKNGYQVIEANSGDAGLEMAQQYHPDLILSDIDMPAGDGGSLLRDIRGHPKLKFTPFLMMSGRMDLLSRYKDSVVRADDCLAKPIILQLLLRRVKMQLSRLPTNWRLKELKLDPDPFLNAA